MFTHYFSNQYSHINMDELTKCKVKWVTPGFPTNFKGQKSIWTPQSECKTLQNPNIVSLYFVIY